MFYAFVLVVYGTPEDSFLLYNEIEVSNFSIFQRHDPDNFNKGNQNQYNALDTRTESGFDFNALGSLNPDSRLYDELGFNRVTQQTLNIKMSHEINF